MSDILARLVAYRAQHTPSDPQLCRLVDEAIFELRDVEGKLKAAMALLENEEPPLREEAP